MKNIFILSIMCLCLSCTKRSIETERVSAFPMTGSLKAEVVPIPVPILLPRYIGVLDDYLYVYKEKEENLFAFFRREDGSYIGDAGRRGQGPDEFIMLDTRSFNEIGGNRFTVLEVGSNLLKTVGFDGTGLSVHDVKSVFKQGIANNGFYSLADSMYLTLGRLEGNMEFCLLDGKTGELTETGTYPLWVNREEIINHPPLFVPYLKTCAVRADGKRVIVFYSRFKRLRIYDDKMNILHDIDVRIEPCVVDFRKPVQEQPAYYTGAPCVVRDYIYVLCTNVNTGIERCELQVWNWEGKPVACFRLDRKVSMIAVDERADKIYAVDSQVDNELYVYDLPLI
ncbi:6-bladed beta-propeller [uncultured Bacteroides sp.]|uniref:6-bladed beta-propeller n=2 Tax=uncultured Bacteroides sp. TaxID=162156 RepID=UPI0025E739B1|nr:6-bladed beta-propeller [uncultured Bacteroides sp.]